jgi:molybdopterin converting factor small subunit
LIRVRLVGHIRTSLSKDELELGDRQIGAAALIEELRRMASHDPRLGFTKFNTIMIVNGGEAFTPAADDRILKDGDTVLLLPFSHGG